MADTVGNIQVVASINTKDYDAGKKHIEKGNADLEKSSSNTSAFIGKAFTAGFAAATAATIAFLTVSIKGFAEYEQVAGGAAKIFNELDFKDISKDAQNAFKTMNLSATNYLKLINQVGANFASTMGDKKGYETAKKGLQAISDFATGTGANVDILGDKFQAITRATATYQSIADQFAGILPPTSKGFLETAQNAGLLSDKYTELTEVPIDEYQAAVSELLKQGVKALGLQGNAAAETSKTISGSFAGMTSSWSNFTSALGTGDTKLAEDALKNLKTTTGDFIKNVGEAAKNTIKTIAEIVNKDKELKAVVFTLSAMAGAFAAIAIAAKIAAIAGTVIAAIINPVTLIVGAILLLVGAITYLQTKFGIFNGVIKALQEQIQPLIDTFNKNFLPVLKQIGSFIGGVFKQAWERISVAFNQAKEALAPFAPQLKIIGALIVVAMVTPLLILVSVITTVIVAITALATGIAFLVGKFAQFFTFVVNGAKQFGTALGKAIVNIKNGFNALPSFFNKLWNNIVSRFKSAGVQIGNSIAGAVRGAVNGILSRVVGTINGFIDNINGVIRIINKIPGVKLSSLGRLPVPQLANGGVVSSATLALIGEGNESEAVLPLSKLDAMLNAAREEGSGNSVHVDTIVIEKNVDVDLVARKLGIKQLNTNRGVV